jgi:hypothetical protein
VLLFSVFGMVVSRVFSMVRISMFMMMFTGLNRQRLT